MAEGYFYPILIPRTSVFTRDLWEHSETNHCQECDHTFGILFDKHHCRFCGRHVCTACSKAQIKIHNVQQRSCKTCYRSLLLSLSLSLSSCLPSSFFFKVSHHHHLYTYNHHHHHHHSLCDQCSAAAADAKMVNKFHRICLVSRDIAIKLAEEDMKAARVHPVIIIK